MQKTVQVVIEIPETAYKVCHDLRSVGDTNCLADILDNAVGVGTVLPEHGRLIDADALDKHMEVYAGVTIDTYDARTMIDDAPTILEATKENI